MTTAALRRKIRAWFLTLQRNHGEPGSYTAIAFGAGVACEQARILKAVEATLEHEYNVPSRDGWSGDMYHVADQCPKCMALSVIKRGTTK